jgi:glutaconate CoA-transferase subunit B
MGMVRGGPLAVVTNLAVMKFEDRAKRMYLAENYPGVTIQRIVENTGFKMDVSKAQEAIPPSDEELRILRTEVDPQRLLLGSGLG